MTTPPNKLEKIKQSLPGWVRLSESKNSFLYKKYSPVRLIVTILLINFIPLFVVALGVGLLGQYRDTLIRSELELLQTRMELHASLIASDMHAPYDKETLNTKLMHFSEAQDTSYFIFDPQLNILAASSSRLDNNTLKTENGETQISGFQKTLSVLYNIFSVEYRLEKLPDSALTSVRNFPGIETVLQGDSTLTSWRLGPTQLVLSSAVPIIRGGQITGVLAAIKHPEEMTDTFNKTQQNVFSLFMALILLSASMSLYLAAALAQPLRRLAKAAESMRSTSKNILQEMPDLGHRGDEIGELSIALRSLTRALWERMESTEKFAADVAHELKNPITSMQSALETLRKVKSKSDKDKLLSILNQDVVRLNRLVTDIAKSSRLDATLARTAFSEIDCKTFIEDLIKTYQERLKLHEITTRITLKSAMRRNTRISGIREQLAQVILNLLDNAVSFSDESDTITVTLTDHISHVALAIEDQGPGIPEKSLNRIFERFYTERDHQKNNFGTHSGLGLSIVKQIVLAHDGTIEAENVTDKTTGEKTGARFTMIFPAKS